MKDATLAQGNQVLNLILQKQVPAEQLQDLLESGLLSDLLCANLQKVSRDEFQRVCAVSVPGVNDGATFNVIVDYGKSLKDMISAGKYDWKDGDINEKHFPSPKLPFGTKSELKMELLNRNLAMTSEEEVIAEAKKLGRRVATVQELLAFGAKYPEEQRKYTIVALGSPRWHWDDGRGVPCLDGSGGVRGLGLLWYVGVGWFDRCCFLVVYES